jgi:hypothetical protein
MTIPQYCKARLLTKAMYQLLLTVDCINIRIRLSLGFKMLRNRKNIFANYGYIVSKWIAMFIPYNIMLAIAQYHKFSADGLLCKQNILDKISYNIAI